MSAAGGAALAALRARTYTEFRERLRNSGCERCGLAAGRTRIVVDRGNPEARVLAVGEAPGASEDAAGIAFCGRSGRLLDALFAEAGLSTAQDLLIVNVVKCRPPANRAPYAGEAARCRPFLERQLALSPAKIVALLGATALRHFDPARARGPLGARVGRFFTLPAFPGRDFVPLYHPAALLYNPSLKAAARRQVGAVARRLAGASEPVSSRL